MTNEQLLAAVTECKGRLEDETLGRVICAILGTNFKKVQVSGESMGVIYESHETSTGASSSSRGYWPRECWPDQSIDAALALARERWPERRIMFRVSSDQCSVGIGGIYAHRDDSNLPLAILACSISCLIKEGDSRS
jgi:hypothetical protein